MSNYVTLNNYNNCHESFTPPAPQKVGPQEPPNISDEKNTFCKMTGAIAKYYGDTNAYMLDTESQYYKELTIVMNKTRDFLSHHASYFEELRSQGITPVVMSDMDDTIWCSFKEAQTAGFCYNPEIIDDYNMRGKMAPIFPMLNLLRHCVQIGIVPVFVTGRAAIPQQAELTSVQLQDFAMEPGQDYWGGDFGWHGKRGKDVVGPPGSGVKSMRGVFMHSGGDTKTGHGTTATVFKSTTRRYIEEHGLPGIGPVKFVASFGDQWSDSAGGWSGLQVKLPNPMYFLP